MVYLQVSFDGGPQGYYAGDDTDLRVDQENAIGYETVELALADLKQVADSWDEVSVQVVDDNGAIVEAAPFHKIYG